MNLLNSFALALPQGIEWLYVACVLIVVAYWIKLIIEIVNSRFQNDATQVIWLIVVVVLNLLGMFLYLTFGRNTRIRNKLPA